ncbi:PREDICTED: uncharacterized protein LOC104816498 [Tarenaya hassleriana]|uniref:uncharacterized protein LOC104816498 n=1 Tax=Tarenaya hassleriana TaxID=28532 RepID=UPI00053C7EB6|nr:PREDICTED: uncharacterized protein LOC104816498 [Tarenaya hassleriana]
MDAGLFFLPQPKQQILRNLASFPFNKIGNYQPKIRTQIQMLRRKISGEPFLRPASRLLVCSAAADSPSPSFSGSPDQYLDDAGTRKNQKMVAGTEQDELLDPVNLADPDSCFCELQGVHIHYKSYDPQTRAKDTPPVIENSGFSQESPRIGFPMVLLHGFGASVFSWSRVMKPLAREIGSKVLAFDRPAFGLTSRIGARDSKPLNPYSIAFSVLATLHFVDFLAAEKAILVGHSAGSLVAVETYFQAPERVAALILVAPAIFAPSSAKTGSERDDERKEEEATDSTEAESPFAKFLRTLIRFGKHIIQAITAIIRGMTSMVGSLYKKALTAFLRSAIGVMLVRMAIEKFGVTAVRNAWYDAKQVTEHIIEGYTKPLRAKGWDRALVEFTVAMLTEKKPPLAKRLKDIKCPVLIVTGDTDRIVPAWNAKRLARAIHGNVVVEVIKECGHLPHEERPQQFISLVSKFLLSAFGEISQLHLHSNHGAVS